MIEIRDEFPNWDRETQKLMNDAFRVSELVTPQLYKWMEYADDSQPLDGTIVKVSRNTIIDNEAKHQLERVVRPNPEP
tara:strand:- start:850 stop:1083 length:234 start_codon:yes stop_codon:yes gene_type:complete